MHELSEPQLVATLRELRELSEQLEDEVPFGPASAPLPNATKAIANEVGLEPCMLDIYLESKSRENIFQLVHDTLERGEKIFEKQKKPDDSASIVAGETDVGVVFLPPVLLRHLWSLGEAVVRLQDGEVPNGAQVEPRAQELMLSAANWVRHSKLRWGRSEQAERVDVGVPQYDPAKLPVPF